VIQEEFNVAGATVGVWAVIWVQGVVGSLFIKGTVTANLYLELLQTIVVPDLEHQYNVVSVIWQPHPILGAMFPLL
jgi:hypothetical protein